MKQQPQHWAVWDIDSNGEACWFVKDFTTKAEAIAYCKKKIKRDPSLDLGVVNMRPVARFNVPYEDED